MSPLLKCFVGLLAIFCFVQFVEMARMRRDDANANGDISETLNKLMEQLKARMDSDEVKNFMKNAMNTISENTKKVADEITKLANNAAPSA